MNTLDLQHNEIHLKAIWLLFECTTGAERSTYPTGCNHTYSPLLETSKFGLTKGCGSITSQASSVN